MVAPTIAYLCTDEAAHITGRFFYVSGGGVCLYERPFQPLGTDMFVYKTQGKWTVDELGEVIPSLVPKA